MFGISNTLMKLNITKEVYNINSYFVNSQTVRWRKPISLGTAKSKIFRVPPRLVLPEDERIELKRLNNIYNTDIKSIRKFLSEKYYVSYCSQTDPEEQNKAFEEDYARCIQVNNKWNEEQKVLREKRVAEELEANLAFARERMELEVMKQQNKFQVIEEIVRKEKQESKNYITPENIDAAIDHALANSVDYNFAINLDGEKIIGFVKKEEQGNASITR